MSTTRRRLNLFVSYAHADEVEEKQLLVHLKALDRGGYYTIWEDRQIEAGQEWDREIKQHLAQADVVLFLVTASLIASDYVWNEELPQALTQRKEGRTDIVPVILKPCDWQEPEFAFNKFQGILNERRPIVLGERDTGYNSVVQELKKVHHRRTGPQPQPLAVEAPPVAAPQSTQPVQDAPTPEPPPKPSRWKGLALALGLTATIGGGGYSYLQHRQEANRLQGQAEVALGWRLLRIGDYAGAATHFGQAPGLDAHGSQAANLGGMLAGLGDDAQRRRFVPALDTLEQEATAGSPAQAYASYLRAVETFERGVRQQDPALWLKGTAERLQAAIQIDPQLADAHALLATLLSLNCQHAEALAVMAQAKAAAADLTPPHYLLEEAQLLQRRDGPGDRQSARALFDAQHTEPEAQLAGALQDLDAARWPEARAALASAAKALQAPAQRPAWLVGLPGGPWLLGDLAGKRCAVAYLRTVADALADGKPGLATAWRAVPDCAPFEPDTRALACAHLPDSAVGARQALSCPTPQPRVRCPAQPTPRPAS